MLQLIINNLEYLINSLTSRFIHFTTGADLPFRYQEMPPEFNGLPITDLDVYYEDKKTFMVISGGKVRNLYLTFPRLCSIH